MMMVKKYKSIFSCNRITELDWFPAPYFVWLYLYRLGDGSTNHFGNIGDSSRCFRTPGDSLFLSVCSQTAFIVVESRPNVLLFPTRIGIIPGFFALLSAMLHNFRFGFLEKRIENTWKTHSFVLKTLLRFPNASYPSQIDLWLNKLATG